MVYHHNRCSKCGCRSTISPCDMCRFGGDGRETNDSVRAAVLVDATYGTLKKLNEMFADNKLIKAQEEAENLVRIMKASRVVSRRLVAVEMARLAHAES